MKIVFRAGDPQLIEDFVKQFNQENNLGIFCHP
jgi:hypothetical protein